MTLQFSQERKIRQVTKGEEVFNEQVISLPSFRYAAIGGESGKHLVINLDEALCSNELGTDFSPFSQISLAAKRNFYRSPVSDLICQAVSEAIEAQPSIAYSYLSVMEGANSLRWEGPPEEPAEEGGEPRRTWNDAAFMAEAVREVMIEGGGAAWVESVVEASYKPSLDSRTVDARRVNEELQFTDDHARSILKASLAARLVVPLATHWAACTGRTRADGLVFDAVSLLFDLFEGENRPSMAKVYKLCQSNVYSTRYSDKVIWSYLRNTGVDTLTFTNRIYRRIVVDTLLKIDSSRNIVTFLISVIRNQVQFQFRQDFPVAYKPVDMLRQDADGMTEFDKIEAGLLRVDEGQAIINRLCARREVEAARRALGSDVTDEEVDYYAENLQPNTIQTNLVFLFFARHARSYQNLYNVTRREYALLVATLRRWLVENGYQVLPDYIVATLAAPLTERKGIARKELASRIMSSRAWDRLHTRKMRWTAENLADSNYVLRTVATMHASDFRFLDPFGGPAAEPGPEGEAPRLEHRAEDLASELLAFLELV